MSRQDGHVEAVKLEGRPEIAAMVHRISQVSMLVIVYVGLMPQRYTALSGYRAQGTTLPARDPCSMAAFTVRIEAIPHRLAEYVTTCLSIPTIGIGAGPGTNGQVLIWDGAITRWHGNEGAALRRYRARRGPRRQLHQ